MILVGLAVVAATLLGFAFRGSLHRFGRPPTQRNGILAFAALAQVTALLALHPGVYAGWLAFGAIALVAYARLNRGRPGLMLAAAGLLLNVIVIGVNWGMPVSVPAAERAGVPAGRLDLGTDPLHEEVDDDTLVPWLTESIPLALPLWPAVASPGDLLAAAGASVFIFTGLTGRGRVMPSPRTPPPSRRARGKKRTPDAAPASAEGATATTSVFGSTDLGANSTGTSAAPDSAAEVSAAEDIEIGAAADALFSPQRDRAPTSAGSPRSADDPLPVSSRPDPVLAVDATSIPRVPAADETLSASDQDDDAAVRSSASNTAAVVSARSTHPAEHVDRATPSPGGSTTVRPSASPELDAEAARAARKREKKQGRKLARQERKAATATSVPATGGAQPYSAGAREVQPAPPVATQPLAQDAPPATAEATPGMGTVDAPSPQQQTEPPALTTEEEPAAAPASPPAAWQI